MYLFEGISSALWVYRAWEQHLAPERHLVPDVVVVPPGSYAGATGCIGFLWKLLLFKLRTPFKQTEAKLMRPMPSLHTPWCCPTQNSQTAFKSAACRNQLDTSLPYSAIQGDSISPPHSLFSLSLVRPSIRQTCACIYIYIYIYICIVYNISLDMYSSFIIPPFICVHMCACVYV